MKKMVAALFVLAAMTAIAACPPGQETAECSAVAGVWAAAVHHPTRAGDYLRWHQENYPELWAGEDFDVPYGLDITGASGIWSDQTFLTNQGTGLAETDTTIAKWFAKVHHHKKEAAYLEWSRNQYRGLWADPFPIRRVVATDSGNCDFWVGYGPGEIPNQQAYGDTLWELIKVWDPDEEEWLNSGLFDRPRPTWPDGSLMEGFMSFKAPRADTFYVMVDTTLTGPAPDSAFAGIPNFAVWVDSSAAGPDTVTFAAATPLQSTLRIPEVMAVNGSPNAYQMWYTPITSDLFDTIEWQLYGRSYADGEVRWWLTMYNSAPLTSNSQGYHSRISNWGGDPANRFPVMGITKTGADSLRIRYASDMYWGDLATADTMGIAGDSLWFDTMVNDSLTAGGWGSFGGDDTEMRVREKVGWQISTGSTRDDAEPTFAYLIPDADGTDPYLDFGHFGTLAAFDYDDDVENGGDSLDIWYEAQVQTGIAEMHDLWLEGTVTVDAVEYQFWKNPRMNHAPYRDDDTGSTAWYVATHSWGEEYEHTYGYATQFLRTAGAVHDSLPATFAREAYELGWALTSHHATQAFYQTDGDIDGEPTGVRNGLWEWCFGHPAHGQGGNQAANRPSNYGFDAAHYNGRNLLLMYRLTMDPVIGEQAYDVIDKTTNYINCHLNSGTPGASCAGTEGGGLLRAEERAPANFVFFLADWYFYTGDTAHRDQMYELGYRTTSGLYNNGTPSRPFLNDYTLICGKKGYQINRLGQALRHAADVCESRGDDWYRDAMDAEAAVWSNFMEARGITCGVSYPHGGVSQWSQFSYQDGGSCCESCSYQSCMSQYASTADTPYANDIPSADFMYGAADPETVHDLFWSGVYYAGGAASGLPWTWYHVSTSSLICGSGQRYLKARNDAE